MKIKCINGYFIFEETYAGDIAKFISLFRGLEIVPDKNIFTFSKLAGAPFYSIKGNQYLGATAKKTFEGNPWDVMRENELVYNFNTGLVVDMNTISQAVSIVQVGSYYTSSGLILPSSRMESGDRVTDYTARYSFETSRFLYTGVVGV